MPAKKTAAKKATKPTAKGSAGKGTLRAASKASPSKAKDAATVPAPAAAPTAPKATEVKLTAAKGRPMLQWVGKKPLSRVTAFPAQFVESYDPAGELKTKTGVESAGNLYYGDNKEVLAHLLANGYRGKVDLIYIDPPFDSAADYVRKVSLRGKSALKDIELDAEGQEIGEQIQYSDIWANDTYLQFMYERLILLRELLTDTGAIYLHCDWRKVHHLRCILEEVFGSDSQMAQLCWMFSTRSATKTNWKRTHHDILFFKRQDDPVFNWDAPEVLEELSESTISKYRLVDDDGRKYRLNGRNIKGSPIRSAKDVDAKYEETNPEWVVRDYLREGKSASDYFFIDIENQSSNARTDYPTQKPEELLRKLISASTKPGALILDCFIGSGTTAAVAQKLGRRWIGCDINKGAIQTTSKRLQGIISDQLAEKRAAETNAQDDLLGGAGGKERDKPTPAALSFRIHRVNDYDLTVQHNEAVALACEHIGVTRTKADAYFDGTQGKRLVKIVPFNHPLSLTDLEQLKTELRAREKEERDILLVCLGKELACDTWLAEWGRLRKRGDVPNKIEVIELRTDPKYGKFIEHKPASAKVSVKRKGSELHISIEDFISPTIIERLDSQDSRLFKAHVTDWRFMVDSVMIDPAYDGQTFNIALTDLPEKKTDLVEGTYTLTALEGETTVAVKITDMLGEEVFVTTAV